MGQKTADVNLWAKWTANVYDIIYKEENGVDIIADSTADLPKIHTYGTATELVSPNRTGYEFLGWHKQPNCSDNSIDTLGASDYTDNITLYAKWNPLGYAIYYTDLSVDNDTATMVTDNCAKTHIYGTPTPIGIPTKWDTHSADGISLLIMTIPLTQSQQTISRISHYMPNGLMVWMSVPMGCLHLWRI